MEIQYHLSPTLIDKFHEYQESEQSWYQFYGDSESPLYTPQMWEDKLLKELVDAVNGEQRESSRAADLGTCLNEAVDCIILGKASTRDDVTIWSGQAGHDGKNDLGECLLAMKDDNKFLFHTEDVVNLASYFKGYVPQEPVSATITDSQGHVVQLYGYPDYYNPTTGEVVDLKTTRSYEWGKYRYKTQRLAYPYMLMKSGKMTKYKEFNFAICKITGDGKTNAFVEMTLTNETYTDPWESMERILSDQVAQFIEWYNVMRERGECNDRLVGERIL